MRKVLVFGRGKLFQAKEDDIRRTYDIVGFLDNHAADQGTAGEPADIPVYHPADIAHDLQPDVWIILASYQYISMWQQLRELGVDGKRILFGISFLPLSEREEILFGEGRCLTADMQGIVYHLDSEHECVIENHSQLQEIALELLRKKYREKDSLVQAIAEMKTEPVSRAFGMERGGAIDRYYIEHFLEKNRELIYGTCLEIAENTYTVKYGQDRVEASYILHLEGWGDNAIKGNLATGEGIEKGKYDCVIITQTLMFIFDINSVAQNIYKMLKPGGNALITVSGISQISRYDADLWGSYYSFHEAAMQALFEPLFGKENVQVNTYGNVKTALAMLYGLCQEDLKAEDYEVVDKDYPVIISAVLKKRM